MVARILELQARRAELEGQHNELMQLVATSDKKILTDAQRTTADQLEEELELVAATITHEQRRLDRERAAKEGRPAPGQDPQGDARRRRVVALQGDNPWGDVSDPEDQGAFAASFGAFLQAVAATTQPGGKVDPRLLEPQAAASGMSSAVPSDGGFLVRTDFSTRLLDRAQEESQLLQKCTRIPIGDGFDGLEAPYIDETSRANGSRWGGVQVFRRAEAETVTSKQPKLGLLEIRLEDLMGIAYATDRSLRDATALGALIEKSFTSEFGFKIDDEIVNGTGVGQCLGILKAVPFLSQAAEGGQTAGTVVAANVQKMFPHMPARLMAGAEWFLNGDVWPQLFGMNQANMPVFMPGISMAGSPYGTLLGRPINQIEQASAVGTPGDINFWNLGEYLVIEKGGLDVQTSMHVRFIYGEKTFRFIYPINGKPSWKAKVTAYKGATDLSPFVGLAQR